MEVRAPERVEAPPTRPNTIASHGWPPLDNWKAPIDTVLSLSEQLCPKRLKSTRTRLTSPPVAGQAIEVL